MELIVIVNTNGNFFDGISHSVQNSSSSDIEDSTPKLQISEITVTKVLSNITNECIKEIFFVIDNHLLKLVLLEEDKRRKRNKNFTTFFGNATKRKVPTNGGVPEL